MNKPSHVRSVPRFPRQCPHDRSSEIPTAIRSRGRPAPPPPPSALPGAPRRRGPGRAPFARAPPKALPPYRLIAPCPARALRSHFIPRIGQRLALMFRLPLNPSAGPRSCAGAPLFPFPTTCSPIPRCPFPTLASQRPSPALLRCSLFPAHGLDQSLVVLCTYPIQEQLLCCSETGGGRYGSRGASFKQGAATRRAR